MNHKIARGYSLIELMVVVAIIGIVTTIAYPSYQNYTCDTFRSQAVADLKVCSLAVERYYSNGFTYVGAAVNATSNSLCSNVSPARTTGNQVKFDVTLENTSATSFLLKATPATGQACGSGTTITVSVDGTVAEI